MIWESTFTSDYFRRTGANSVEGTAEAIVKGSKIESFTFSLSQQTLANMQRADGHSWEDSNVHSATATLQLLGTMRTPTLRAVTPIKE